MVRFDDVPDRIREILAGFPGGTPRAIVVRDANGLATVVLLDDVSLGRPWSEVAGALHERLGRYSPGQDRVLLYKNDLIDPEDVLDSSDKVPLRDSDESRLWIVDRLITNQDWLRPAIVTTPVIKTAAAFSIKGGVGRSTALAILAWSLARQGKHVLVTDLDLEAPGIGGMLLGEEDQPEYGLVDWLVESLVDEHPDDGLLEDMLARSPIATETSGSLLVIPAFGMRTQNYVAKLGRVYMPTYTENGSMLGLADRVANLIHQVAARAQPPEVVLLDARAGLHDIGAAVVTQLGAEVFLFARDDPSSWDGWSRLFDHMRNAHTVKFGMPDDDLRWRLKMVAAQLDILGNANDRFIDRSYACWSSFYDEETETTEAQTFDRVDESAPHYPLTIAFDTRMRGLSLVDPDQRPDWEFIEATFGKFLAGARERLFESEPGTLLEVEDAVP